MLTLLKKIIPFMSEPRDYHQEISEHEAYKIVHAVVVEGKKFQFGSRAMHVTLSDGSLHIAFYWDEHMEFKPADLIGLTMKEARQHKAEQRAYYMRHYS